MCNDNRHYTAATVNALQQAAANIEAERRRQYRAEMAQALRAWILGETPTAANPNAWNGDDFWDGRHDAMVAIMQKLNELSPPTMCDSN